MFTTKYMKNQPKAKKQRVRKFSEGGSVSDDRDEDRDDNEKRPMLREAREKEAAAKDALDTKIRELQYYAEGSNQGQGPTKTNANNMKYVGRDAALKMRGVFKYTP